MAKDTFTDALRRVWQQARVRKPNPDELIQEFRRITEAIALEDTNEVETRGPGYLWCPVNHISNGSFETDLTGWTESIDAGITATTARTIEDAYTIEGSLGSLEVIVTASAGAGYAVRYQTITGLSAGEVWSFDMFGRTVSAGLRLTLRVEWLSAADAVLFTVGNDFEEAAGDWHSMGSGSLNLTAPANTAKVRVSIGIRVTAGLVGNTGTVRCDLVRAERASTVSTRLTRIIADEWTVEAA